MTIRKTGKLVPLSQIFGCLTLFLAAWTCVSCEHTPSQQATMQAVREYGRGHQATPAVFSNSSVKQTPVDALEEPEAYQRRLIKLLMTNRFDLLDAFRGLAALAVVIHHVIGSQNHSFQFGQPAVMVFFVISGYCIASAADACQRRGLGFLQFMWRRVRRIYPPYLLSLVFWIATRAFKWRVTDINELGRPWTAWLQNFTLTQWLTLLWHPANSAVQNSTLFVVRF